MLQPLPDIKLRTVGITCFVCQEDIDITLRSWELTKKITCPQCHKKGIIIRAF